MKKIHLDTDIGGDMYEIPDSDGIPTRLVTKIDGNAFNEYWYDILCC